MCFSFPQVARKKWKIVEVEKYLEPVEGSFKNADINDFNWRNISDIDEENIGI